MTPRIEKMKENVIDKSTVEKWNDDCKNQYLKKIYFRINIYEALLNQRDDFKDLLYLYLKRKIKELKIIHDDLYKKWKK